MEEPVVTYLPDTPENRERFRESIRLLSEMIEKYVLGEEEEEQPA